MTTPPNNSYHHGNLRQALIEGATTLLRRDGYAALTLRAAAREAGVSQAAPYKHFADKQALLAAVAERGFASLLHCCQTASDDAPLPRKRLQQLGQAYVGFALREPALFRLMFSAELEPLEDHPGLASAASAVYRALEQAVEAILQSEGLAQDQATACASAWSLVHGLAFLLLERRIRLPAEGEQSLILRVTATFTDSLGPPTGVD